MLKKALLTKIERERKLHTPEQPGRIQFKMNALEDVDIVRALYEAAREGVGIDLIVRDTCRFRPGLEGLSETARVVGIVGRFLEHTRIYYFQNGGDEEYFIGSADCMKRNLESRVEVVVRSRRPRCGRNCASSSTPSSRTSAAPGKCSPTAATCSAGREPRRRRWAARSA